MEETLKYINSSVSDYVNDLFSSCLVKINIEDKDNMNEDKVEDMKPEDKKEEDVEWKGFDSIDINVEAIVSQEKEELDVEIIKDEIKIPSPVISRKESARSKKSIKSNKSVKKEQERRNSLEEKPIPQYSNKMQEIENVIVTN